jgi:hypothetical protein
MYHLTETCLTIQVGNSSNPFYNLILTEFLPVEPPFLAGEAERVTFLSLVVSIDTPEFTLFNRSLILGGIEGAFISGRVTEAIEGCATGR